MAQTLRDAYNQFEATRAEIVKQSKSTTDSWKMEYARLRPQLQADLSALAMAADAAHDDGTLKEMVQEARSLLESHQARWPVVLIDSKNPDYKASIKAIDDIFTRLGAQVRKTS